MVVILCLCVGMFFVFFMVMVIISRNDRRNGVLYLDIKTTPIREVVLIITFGTPDRIRTYGLRLRKPTLYPAELRVHMIEPVVLRTTGTIL